ncbi:hypothetical protein M9H77_02899 [Catharanthus roseus]|uniref:Uncharacterized protein n=1 Tax=Catharanthus roseus TaxID=4058 RepID=A0ACC0CA79_CATRO|nr:hypothetical protein M9H77_02899 [Catharanthus roseus]
MDGEQNHLLVNDQRNLKWTDEMDNYLIDTLLDQKLKGQKIGGSFTKIVYRAVAIAVTLKFVVSCDLGHVKNRVKTLKKHLTIVKDLLQKKSGFGFNYSTLDRDVNLVLWRKCYLSCYYPSDLAYLYIFLELLLIVQAEAMVPRRTVVSDHAHD